MRQPNDLLALYAQWRRLSELEGYAIHEGEWCQVQEKQDLKSLLKEQILTVTESWQTACPDANRWRQEYERQFRPIVTELIQMESRNSELLSQRQMAVRTELERTCAASRNLRGLRTAYTMRSTEQWSSYS